MTTPGSWPPPSPDQPPPPSVAAPRQPTSTPHGIGPHVRPPTNTQPPVWGPPPPQRPQQPGTKRSLLPLWWTLTLVVLLIAACATGFWAYRTYTTKQTKAQIHASVSAFALASDTADAKKLASMMCQEEADQFLDGFEANDDTPIPVEYIRPRHRHHHDY